MSEKNGDLSPWCACGHRESVHTRVDIGKATLLVHDRLCAVSKCGCIENYGGFTRAGRDFQDQKVGRNPAPAVAGTKGPQLKRH